MVLYAFQIFPCVARSDELLLTIGSEVDINATHISAYLADSMDKLTDSTTINQADDNEPFNEYNGDDWNQADYPIVIICDWIWEKLASTYTTARHTFNHHTTAVHIN